MSQSHQEEKQRSNALGAQIISPKITEKSSTFS